MLGLVLYKSNVLGLVLYNAILDCEDGLIRIRYLLGQAQPEFDVIAPRDLNFFPFLPLSLFHS